MNGAAALAALAVLLLPVGINRSLRRAGARAGLPHALPLLGAGWLACCLAIGTWCTALGLLVLALPAARPAVQVAAAIYLLGRLLARRRDAELGIWSMFPAALADPAVLWCAVFAFPALGTPAPAVLAAYGWFSVMMLAGGLGWSAVGAGVLPRRAAQCGPRPRPLGWSIRRLFLLAAATVGAARAR